MVVTVFTMVVTVFKMVMTTFRMRGCDRLYNGCVCEKERARERERGERERACVCVCFYLKRKETLFLSRCHIVTYLSIYMTVWMQVRY